jgi:chemotaxis protein histidine kinase CheA
MKIYPQEEADGLSERISTSASISYACAIQSSSKTDNISKALQSIASLNDEDLYYVQSILVSTTWNKNDDIFDKKEVWAARNTPEDKPTNLEHDEGLIIGHITSNWPITEDGILINENTPIDNLPEKYHILTGSVIYRAFASPELKERSEKLISEIQSGQKYVSMECFFKGFDYGLLNKSNGQFSILTRNEATAYLTKYLRAYGGQGQHEEYQIGRVLRNITFSGKGFVDKPANPDSIIFTLDNLYETKNDNFNNLGVSNSQFHSNTENINMSADLKPEMVESTEQTETVSVSSVEATTENNTNNTELQLQLESLEAAMKSKDEEMKKLKAELDAAVSALSTEAAKKMKEEEEKNEVEDKKESKKEEDKEEETEAANKMKDVMAKKDEEMKKVKSELDAALEAIAGYKMKEAEMAKKDKKMKRAASLMENGFDSETANSTVDQFESLDDDTFAAVTSLVAGKMPPWLLNKKKDDEKKKDKEEAAVKVKASETPKIDETVLDTVVAEESVDLSVGGSDVETSVASTRSALVEFVYSRLGKTLNKGE